MMYLLDFDMTLFDRTAYIEYLKEHPVASRFAHLSVPELADALDMSIQGNELVFAPGELAPFLYPDVRGFLEAKGNSAMVVTYGHTSLQKAKIASALHGIPRIAVMYTADRRKGDFLAPYISMYGAAPVFTDDLPEELEVMEARCPGVQVFQMCRNNGIGDGRWPVVQALSELP